MKKILALTVVLALVMSLSTVASAQNVTDAGTYRSDVMGTTVTGDDVGITYSIDITWPSLSFTYYEQVGEKWDTEKHEGIPAVPARWEGGGDITIVNHSNSVIAVTPSYTAESEYSDAKIIFDTTELYVDNAANGNEAKTGTINISATGSLPTGTSNQKIGEVKLYIGSAFTERKTADELLYREYDVLVSQLNQLRTSIANADSNEEYQTAQELCSSASGAINSYKDACRENGVDYIKENYMATIKKIADAWNAYHGLEAKVKNGQI